MENDRSVFAALVHDNAGRQWLVNTDGLAFAVQTIGGHISKDPYYERDLAGNWIPANPHHDSERKHKARGKDFEKKFQSLLRAWQPYLNN